MSNIGTLPGLTPIDEEIYINGKRYITDACFNATHGDLDMVSEECEQDKVKHALIVDALCQTIIDLKKAHLVTCRKIVERCERET